MSPTARRRYFVRVIEIVGTEECDLRLNTGSIELSTAQHLLEFVQQAVQLAQDAERLLYRVVPEKPLGDESTVVILDERVKGHVD